MKTVIDLFYRLLNAILIVLLSGMALMVFVNVVLRYVANSGIDLSEEMSRYFFVWITFIGAVVAHREHLHLGVETLVAHVGRKGRLFLMGLSNLIVLVCSAIFCWGTWVQLPINSSMVAPVSGLSMGWVYGIGLFTGGGIVLITLERLFRLVTGRITNDEIAAFAGENLTLEQMAERT
jgi:TRAP-type C4-dicarboxylate transport system permease small subunit